VITTPADVVNFWFSERVRPLRFRSTPAFDQEILNTYLSLWHAAVDHQLDHWLATPEGALALVIVLDQFPLHMFRGEARSFASEQQARECADFAIQSGFDQQLSDEQKAFLYLPFMHSESLADQDRAVYLYEAAGLTDNLRWAKHHRDIIRRFSRFPHRNSLLGRISSPDEIDYLNSKEGFYG
jgi:uncharacterized protein (DUF924 family)